MAQIQLMDRGVIGKQDLRHLMRRANLIDSERTDEDLDGDVESEDMLFTDEPEAI